MDCMKGVEEEGDQERGLLTCWGSRLPRIDREALSLTESCLLRMTERMEGGKHRAGT